MSTMPPACMVSSIETMAQGVRTPAATADRRQERSYDQGRTMATTAASSTSVTTRPWAMAPSWLWPYADVPVRCGSKGSAR
ncbi:MAG TPA: hypothetical protein VFS43_42335 [Polyangiaceae bacterium]|nr:hypothetical protein [Polyangiaceae bacterium]